MRGPTPSPESLSTIDNDLRISTPPFDGLSDLSVWLGLDTAAMQNGGSPAIVIRVRPPIDLITDRCELRDDRLTLVMHAHPSFDTSQIRVAIRGVPSDMGLGGRQQIAERIEWGPISNNRREGRAHIETPNCDSVLAILMSGASTIRRHWTLDPNKAGNSRYMAINHFDRDLRKIRNAILETLESSKFEQGVAALLFLLGYSPVQ
jgi:hypothetical protein